MQSNRYVVLSISAWTFGGPPKGVPVRRLRDNRPVTEPEQTYCDWCDSTLTEKDRVSSQALEFDKIQTWACNRCIDENRVSEAPGGWEGPWPAEPK